MTYQIYDRQQLKGYSLAQLKDLATKIGAVPTDKRSKQSHIEAILAHQPQPQEPAPLDYLAKCLALARVRTLHDLKSYCLERQISQGAELSHLYANILNYQLGFDSAYESKPSEWGSIDHAINEAAELSEAICEELQIVVVDLSVMSDDVIPHGVDAYHAYYDNRLIASISTWGASYISSASTMRGGSDPYTAILETIDPQAVATARATVERRRELKAMSFTDAEKIILTEYQEKPWLKAAVVLKQRESFDREAIERLIQLGIIKHLPGGMYLSDDGQFHLEGGLYLSEDARKQLDSMLMPDYA